MLRRYSHGPAFFVLLSGSMFTTRDRALRVPSKSRVSVATAGFCEPPLWRIVICDVAMSSLSNSAMAAGSPPPTGTPTITWICWPGTASGWWARDHQHRTSWRLQLELAARRDAGGNRSHHRVARGVNRSHDTRGLLASEPSALRGRNTLLRGGKKKARRTSGLLRNNLAV